MKNADLPGKPLRSSSPIDDIPEAIRELPTTGPKTNSQQRLVIWGAIAALGMLTLLSLGFVLQAQQFGPTDAQNNSVPSGTSNEPGNSAGNPANADTLLGHFVYKEAPQQELVPLVADGSIRLRKAAAEKYKAMVEAAQADGISLVTISGFRNMSEQQHVFFDVKAERAQAATKRAEVSAPPGYSEHHTGYAVDIGDGNVPATDLNPDFEKTAAFKWLVANAPRFNFEMSFPKNNPQGVSYEPWHWRFIGDRDSLETFYKARSSK